MLSDEFMKKQNSIIYIFLFAIFLLLLILKMYSLTIIPFSIIVFLYFNSFKQKLKIQNRSISLTLLLIATLVLLLSFIMQDHTFWIIIYVDLIITMFILFLSKFTINLKKIFILLVFLRIYTHEILETKTFIWDSYRHNTLINFIINNHHVTMLKFLDGYEIYSFYHVSNSLLGLIPNISLKYILLVFSFLYIISILLIIKNDIALLLLLINGHLAIYFLISSPFSMGIFFIFLCLSIYQLSVANKNILIFLVLFCISILHPLISLIVLVIFTIIIIIKYFMKQNIFREFLYIMFLSLNMIRLLYKSIVFERKITELSFLFEGNLVYRTKEILPDDLFSEIWLSLGFNILIGIIIFYIIMNFRSINTFKKDTQFKFALLSLTLYFLASFFYVINFYSVLPYRWMPILSLIFLINFPNYLSRYFNKRKIFAFIIFGICITNYIYNNPGKNNYNDIDFGNKLPRSILLDEEYTYSYFIDEKINISTKIITDRLLFDFLQTEDYKNYNYTIEYSYYNTTYLVDNENNLFIFRKEMIQSNYYVKYNKYVYNKEMDNGKFIYTNFYSNLSVIYNSDFIITFY